MEKKIRILQVLNSLGMGGIESLATDILKNINKDEFEVDFCIMEGKDTNRLYDVQNLGAKVYYYPKLNFKSIFKFKKWWRDFFKSHQYDIVHGHVFTSASLYLPIAKKFGMHTIVHSHNTKIATKNKNCVDVFLRKMLLVPLKSANWIDARLACSKDAGRWLFGNKEFVVIKNAIDSNKFIYNEDIRNKYRNDLKLDNCFVVGHVGNGTEAKNHMFLLEVFKHIHQIDCNTRLLLIGKLENIEIPIRDYLKNNFLEDSVMILGVRKDVNNLMMAMDTFVFPSFYEGMPVTIVESQATGLVTLCSKEGVPEEANITGLFHYISLEESAEKWASTVMKYRTYNRRNMQMDVINAGYDISTSVKTIENYYKKLIVNW